MARAQFKRSRLLTALNGSAAAVSPPICCCCYCGSSNFRISCFSYSLLIIRDFHLHCTDGMRLFNDMLRAGMSAMWHATCGICCIVLLKSAHGK